MYRLSIFLLCAVSFLALAAADSFAGGLYGQWSGTADQSGPGDYKSSYPAKMMLQGETGQADYPSLGCGGALTLENQRENFYFYRESITYGQKKCIDGGLIAFEPEGNSVHWAWNGSGATATGVFTGRRYLPPCNECSASRDRCFAGCDNEPTLPEKSDCVNQCNKEYSCVIGYDCN
jgi:hypothetical protein